jgi:uncharacterized glyoxalase superfamily protein PhnB
MAKGASAMTMTRTENETPAWVDAVPEGYHTVTPCIISRDTTKLIDFVREAFRAVELSGSRAYGEDESITHVEMRIGDSPVVMLDAQKDVSPMPAFMRLYVRDGDEVFKRALECGATAITEPTDMPWGDRVSRVRDPLGNLWWIMTHMDVISPDELESRMKDERWKKAMQSVDSLEFLKT